jgi:hypothetical protein
MKRFFTILLLAWAGGMNAQSVTLTWDASPSASIAGYRVYYGTNSRVYGFVIPHSGTGLALTQTVALPWPGRWFFAATAFDTNGLESCFSNEVQWEAKPEPPVMQGEAFVRLSPVIERSTNQVDWSSLTGAPTFLAATNRTEFFRAQRLIVEDARRVNEN